MKKILSVFMAVCLVAGLCTGLSAGAFAADSIGMVTVSVEKLTLGQGYIKEPVQTPIYEGDTVYSVTERLMGENGLIGSSGYVTAFYDGASEEEAAAINPPDYIMRNSPMKLVGLQGLIDQGRQNAGYLTANDYYNMYGYGGITGWMFTRNNAFADVGANFVNVSDGDVIRWQFTLAAGLEMGCTMADGVMGRLFHTPEDRDSLLRKVASINSAENREELLSDSNMQAAYSGAIAALSDLESTREQLDQALAALDGDVPPSESEELTLTLPAAISGAAGAQFNAVVSVGKWETDAKAIEGILTIPDGLEVVDVVPADSLTGGSVNYYLKGNTLRFAYISSELATLELTAELPAQLFTVRLKLAGEQSEGASFTISVDSLRVLTTSDADPYNYDTGSAEGTVNIAASLSATARELYTGDGEDLIPTDKKAVAVDFVNLEGAPGVSFGDIPFYYSSELSEVRDTVTYVALVDADLSLEDLSDADQYASEGDAAAIRFADVDDSGAVNAQDALNVLSAWLRKTDAPEGKYILMQNVTADGRIDTVDVLAIVEFYISDTPFAVLSA